MTALITGGMTHVEIINGRLLTVDDWSPPGFLDVILDNIVTVPAAVIGVPVERSDGVNGGLLVELDGWISVNDEGLLTVEFDGW